MVPDGFWCLMLPEPGVLFFFAAKDAEQYPLEQIYFVRVLLPQLQYYN